jgi:transcription initiation factor TFIID subunit TAF12
MREIGPGLQVEFGMDSIFGEALDAFVESVARDAVRLAAHRRSGRVEARDVGFILKETHDISLPGFAMQVPERVHVPEDSNKRARLVAPRAGRRRDDE